MPQRDNKTNRFERLRPVSAQWSRRQLLRHASLIASSLLASSANGQPPTGKKFALIVGIRDYDHDKFTTLLFTENDAEGINKALGKDFTQRIILTTERGKANASLRPTAANIRAALQSLVTRTTKHDTLLVALAGHGLQMSVQVGEGLLDEGFFCPADARPEATTNLAQLSKTMISFRELFAALEKSGAGAKLLLVDACRDEPQLGRNLESNKMPQLPNGTAALFSCKGGERAFETKKLGAGHGVFFYHVIQALEGGAANEKGEVTWDDLARKVRPTVVDVVPELIGGGARQTPQEIKNFVGLSPVITRHEIPSPPQGPTQKSRPDSPDVWWLALPAGASAVLAGAAGWWLARRRATVAMTPVLPQVSSPQPKPTPPPQAIPLTPVRPPAQPRQPTPPAPAPTTPDVVTVAGIRLKLINPGAFMMGSSSQEERRNDDEQEHRVEITKPFYLGVYPVSQKQYEAITKQNPSFFRSGGSGGDRVWGLDTGDFPVERVSWDDAQDFLQKLNAQTRNTGLVLRLPSEAEWEYACRAGATSVPFSFGASLSSAQANFNGEHPYGGASHGPNLRRTCKVGSFSPNAFGLYDMHGNVWEWCQDRYQRDYYARSSPIDPRGPDTGQDRVCRGGSWAVRGHSCRSACRYGSRPSDRTEGLGFRVAASLS